MYLAEAHPKGMWNFGTKYYYMEQHGTIEERIQAARDLITADSSHNTFTTDPADHSKVRLVLDTMDNAFAIAYSAHPDRAIIIDSSGKVAYIGNNIAMQLDVSEQLMTDEIRHWMENNN